MIPIKNIQAPRQNFARVTNAGQGGGLGDESAQSAGIRGGPDFALAGQAAFDAPHLASRVVMFRLYYLGLAPYERARHFLGLSEHGWVNWSEEIRRKCGLEILRRGMFPPRKYFSGIE